MGYDYDERGLKWDLQQNPFGFEGLKKMEMLSTKEEEAATLRVRLWLLFSLSPFPPF